MKILNVRFKNMNTLKGEWELHFDRSPFKESGLFAITGPNGSGKSTIFDTISLGMYGEVVRQKNPSGQIISSETSGGYSMVTFSVNGNLFRSTWSLNAGKNEPPIPEMRLIELSDNERVMEEGIVKVRNRIAELTGLDFKRFSRAVMLAQGEFAEFINALDNERIEILEKIIGRHMYSAVLENAIRHLETADNRLIELKEKIQDFQLMSPSDVETLKETSRQLEEDLQSADRSITRLEEKEQQLVVLTQLKSEYNENQIGLAEALGRKEQMRADFLRLEKATAAASFEKNIEELGRERKRASEDLVALNQLNSEIAGLKARLDTLAETNKQLTIELENDQKVWSERFTFIEGALEMDRGLRSVNDSINRLSEKRLSINNERKTKHGQQLAIQQKISENNAGLKKTENWLSKHENEESLADNMAEIKDKLETLQSIRNNLITKTTQKKTIEKAEQKASKLFKKATRKLEKCRKKAQKKQNDRAGYQQTLIHLLGGDSLEALAEQMADKKTQMANYQAMLKIAKAFGKEGFSDDETLETALKAAEKRHVELLERFEQEKNALSMIKNIARFEPCRKQLKEKEPCPLCGSLDHPYVDHEPPFAKASLETLREQEEKLERIEQQIQIHTNQSAAIKRRHERLVEIKNKWILLSRSTGIQCRIGDRHAVREAIGAMKQEKRKLRDRLRVIRKHNKKIEKHQSASKKVSDSITEKQRFADKLQQDVHHYQQTRASLEKEVQTDREKEAELKKEIRRNIDIFNVIMPRSGREEEIIKQLENRRLNYIDHLKRQNELNEQVVVLNSNYEDLNKELERLEKEIKDLDGQINAKQEAFQTLKIKREEAFGPGDALQEQQDAEKALQEKSEKQKSIEQEIQQASQIMSDKKRQKQANEKTLAEIQFRCEEMEKHLLESALSLGFDTLEDLERSLLPFEQRRSLEQEKASIDQAIDQYTDNLEKIREKLGGEDPWEMAVESEEDLRSQIEAVHKQKDELEQELSLAVDGLARHKASVEAYDQMVQEMEEQEKMRGKLYEEKCFFESADDAEIKARVREMMLEQLLEHSNRHLEELSGRYYLRRRELNGLELEIEDIFQKRTRRPINTLSGGESFLVSIAMALGLSDMSGNGQKIESLFIDEGFGYLDDETLYNVLSTLKNLKNKRKMVGIVSHIKMLENEIPTKVKITKLSGGVSRLDVVA